MARKKKTRTADPSPAASGTVTYLQKVQAKPQPKVPDSFEQFFYVYADKQSGLIEPQGIESLCSDLEVDHTDVRMLMLAWKMQAAKQGYFTLDEWRKTVKALKCDTVLKLKRALVNIEKEAKSESNFEDFFSYAFKYCLTEELQKNVDIETICVLLELVLAEKFRVQVDSFIQFLQTQTDYKVMNMDQWVCFFRFCNEISYPDLKNYDDDFGWPSMLDDFVEWLRLPSVSKLSLS